MMRCPDCGWPMEGKVCLHCHLEDYDNSLYLKFCSPGVIDKLIATLEGIVTGIALDKKLSDKELHVLDDWCIKNCYLADKKPYNELFDSIFDALDDYVLTLDEKDNLLWLCQKLHSKGSYYDDITHRLQILHGILFGIMADGKITKDELYALQGWLSDNEILSTYYPFDEVYSLVADVLKDGTVSPSEEEMLKSFFSIFSIGHSISTNKSISAGEFSKNGICALSPNIEFEDSIFCFTGKSAKATRAEIASAIQAQGGKFCDNVTKNTNYLIVGDNGNVCWCYSCYGRKVEKAIDLRKRGNHILIVSEIDFWDCL